MNTLRMCFPVKRRSFRDIRYLKRGLAAGIVGALGIALASPTIANPIKFYNDASSQKTLRFTIGCGSETGDCDGLVTALIDNAPTTYDSSTPLIGDLFKVKPSSLASETAFVNANTVGGDSFTTGTKTNAGGSEGIDFTTSADYVLFKVGKKPNYGLLHNLDRTLHLYFSQDGQGAGLSHYTEFGPASNISVPEPSALGLGLMGFGLVVLGFLGRRPPKNRTRNDQRSQ